MWLTGFDVPSLSTLYLDKPLKAHTLMQAIARANRIHEGKNNGLIVDYCGILKHLRKALATFSGQADDGRGGEEGNGELDPTRPKEELIQDLEESIELIKAYLLSNHASLDDVINLSGFERNAAIEAAKEAANQNDESRKRFEIMCRESFKKFKSCINISEVNAYREDYDAINVIYKTLQKDREDTDISGIIQELHKIVDESIHTVGTNSAEEAAPYDISRINFDRLRQEFASSTRKNTTVQNLKQAIENRLRKLLAMNPARTDYQKHYESIVEEYNKEKDRVTIEATFDALLTYYEELNEEETRAVREGLDEESLAIFDLLKRPELSKKQISAIKKVSKGLLTRLKEEKLSIDHWREKESTRDAVRQSIHDFLYDDKTGLPVDSYTDDDVQSKATDVFQHVFRVYPELPSPFYQSKSA
jgi:type I restriction enzyme R subunit